MTGDEQYGLVICGSWQPEHAQTSYPGGVRQEHCFICGAAVATSNLNYARAEADTPLPLKIACIPCGMSLTQEGSEIRGVLQEGRLPGDPKGGAA